MKFNKRILAAAAVSVSLVAPTVAPVAQAADSHQNCEQRFVSGLDFNSQPAIAVAQHLEKNCGLTKEQISQLSVDELKSVAKELKNKNDEAVFTDEEISTLDAAQVNQAIAPAPGANEAGQAGGQDNADGDAADQQMIVSPQVNDITAGDKKVTGTVRLYPSAKKYEFAATFPGGQVAKTQLDAPAVAATVNFEIAVPEGVELKAGDEVFVTPVPNVAIPGTNEGPGKNVTVKPAAAPGGEDNIVEGGKEHDQNEKPAVEPKEPKGSSDFGKGAAALAGLGGLAALVAGIVHLVSHHAGGAHFLQPVRDFLAQFNIKI
ncbi:hypothetical protein [Corynebacterium sp.]|uniref:hypothetical protein n=1 Tax=Corynebacterium sp. TaxID=1720 RepID=UPI0027B9EAB8|nr:hypothetical protein [Corynebacterium sp.]